VLTLHARLFLINLFLVSFSIEIGLMFQMPQDKLPEIYSGFQSEI